MNRQQNLTGRPSVVNDDQLAAMSSSIDKPYPLGIPRRVFDGIRKSMESFAQTVDELLGTSKVHKVTHMTKNDVPGVLIAAGIDEILASLRRIQCAQGFESSDRAYRAILARALADGRDDVAQQMTQARERLIRARAEQAGTSTRVHDLMQQKADEAQRNAQAVRLTEREANAAKAAAFNAQREVVRNYSGIKLPGEA